MALQMPALPPDGLEPRRSIAEQIADQLRAEILSAAIGPDQPLKQDHVARRFGVSQAPVREALRQLAAEGLVVARLNRGTRVAPFDEREAKETAALRLKLEPELIKAAARNFEAADRERAAAALAAIAEAGDVPALM
ncbi:MAG: GntR family transcriptional regulator, partial [Methyloligellaceae bacterium]